MTPTRTPVTPADVAKAELFDKHFCRFTGGIGTEVVFKRPKRPKEHWEVIEVKNDPFDVTWTSGGTTPNYIKLRQVGCPINVTPKECWTCENKLRIILRRD